MTDPGKLKPEETDHISEEHLDWWDCRRRERAREVASGFDSEPEVGLDGLTDQQRADRRFYRLEGR